MPKKLTKSRLLLTELFSTYSSFRLNRKTLGGSLSLHAFNMTCAPALHSNITEWPFRTVVGKRKLKIKKERTHYVLFPFRLLPFSHSTDLLSPQTADNN
jgi:hypothetical protein